ncbi:unnamed protein product [Euphydryas editha]|uniref:Cytochrome P450 n=1 Tax=Euphydryas editha TaxID=104508 RepID=A0AAU9TLL2_EUPED|nr:unnamed protein product [Euphydryas editha]
MGDFNLPHIDWDPQGNYFTLSGISLSGAQINFVDTLAQCDLIQRSQNIREASGLPVYLSNMITHSVGNVVNDLIFGFKFPLEDKTWHWFRKIQEEGCHEMGVAGVVSFLPFVRFIYPSIQNTIKVLVRGQAQTHRLYPSIISRRRQILGLQTPEKAKYHEHANLFNEHPEGFIKCVKYSKHASNTEVHYFDPKVLIASEDKCILDNFLMEQKRRYENGEENALFMTDEQMYFLLADMFGAGLDTTSTTLSWYLLYMALYQEEQERVRKEIITVYPEECPVDSSKLTYLMATVCET